MTTETIIQQPATQINTTPKDVEAVALRAYAAGIQVIFPTEDGTKRPDYTSWAAFNYGDDGTPPTRRHTPDEIRAHYAAGHTGLGGAMGRASGRTVAWDFDNRAVSEEFGERAEATGLGRVLARLRGGLSEDTPQGVHIYARVEGDGPLPSVTPAKKKMPAEPGRKPTYKPLIEVKGDGGFIIMAPSCGNVNTNGVYTVRSGSVETIATITAEEYAALLELAVMFDETERSVPRDPEVKIGENGHSARPGDDFNQKATWAEVLEPHGWRRVYTKGDTEYWRRPDKNVGVSASTNYKDSRLLYVFSTSTEFEDQRGYSPFSAYTLLNHGGDFQAAAKELGKAGYGAPLPKVTAGGGTAGNETPPSWPEPMNEAAYHGLIGQLVRAIEPCTEADPAAVLLTLLVAVGNAMGRNVYTKVGPDRHGVNLDGAIVGDTAKGRKGTSAGHVREIFKRVDPEWADARVSTGLSSGEGLIWAVRDPIEKSEPIKEKGRPTGEYITVIVDAGISDKRLLVLESELASTLSVMERKGNTLSPVVRLAWDSGDLQVMTKNSPAVATKAHISIIGHITRDELLRHLSESDSTNGFANRFLWCCARRSKLLPDGGGVPAYGNLVHELKVALERARTLGEISRDAQAAAAWAAVYEELSSGKPGLFGAVTARAEAQVIRLSTLYAAIDGSKQVRPEHLLAALAVWEYCEASARYIFGDATGDPIADRIMAALKQETDGLSRTEISSLFANNVSGTRIDHSLAQLRAAGRVACETVPPASGKGRPAEVWHAK